MKKEDIIALVAVVVIACLVIIFGAGMLYPHPPGQSRGIVSAGNMMGPAPMGSGMAGGEMMGGTGIMALYSANSRPVSPTEARTRALAYINQYYPGAAIGDFMEFSLNYYVGVKDASNQSIAEILVDRYSGTVTPEPGPNRIWNTQFRRQDSAEAIADTASAQTLAEQFLAGYLPGATVMESARYPGYYTFDFGRGHVEGMLSVNAYTGAVWVHTWHGQYIGE